MRMIIRRYCRNTNICSKKQYYSFIISPTIAKTKDLWRKSMDEVSVSEVL